MDSVIIHYHEIALKGKNRPWFIERLVSNLRDATSDLNVQQVRALMGRVEISLGPQSDWVAVRERVSRIFGIANYAQARATGRDVEEIATAILQDLERNDRVTSGLVEKFRVRASRADKAYRLTSPEIEREIGGRIKQATGWQVDLTQPDINIKVEVLPDRVFYAFGKEPGPGGLPTGTSGAAMCLLSGGIDSPVAAFRLMKRGCRVRFVHFHAYPILSHASQEKTTEIVELLTRYQLSSRMYTVPFGELQQQVVMMAPSPLRVVLYRRLMMRIAERLAFTSGAKALVTGESVGQVASQTLENLSVINEVVTLPVLRPLIGCDKEEITNEAKRIETYGISIIPDQDCCTLFTPKSPATKAKRDDVERAENQLPLAKMVDTAIELTERRDFVFPFKEGTCSTSTALPFRQRT